jgi:hypothetical protein
MLLTRKRRRVCLSVALCTGAAAAITGQLFAQEPPRQTQAVGRIAGTVVDVATGRAVSGASIEIVGTTVRAVSDLEGRYRTPPIPAGLQTLQVSMLGFATLRIDSVQVPANEVVNVPVALQPSAIQLEGVTVSVTGQRASSAAGLLAVQKNAAAVTDGISAEQMSRSPDSDAADAMIRMSGVSVVDGKFVIVRGLAERYSNTLLNGVEIASPEPARRIVPLDIFPSGLLESIVTSKTATPDMPGDFAGGSVNIKTKDFPERRIFELKVSQGYNSLTTFKSLPVFTRSGLRDYTGFDGGNRYLNPVDWAGIDPNRFAESIRPAWRPGLSQVYPDMGMAVHLGDQLGEFERALGFVLSFDYGYKTSYQADDYFALVEPTTGLPTVEALTVEGTTVAEWGGVANATLRLGPSHTLGIKNLLTQESEEYVMSQRAFDPEVQDGFGNVLQRHQVRYIERSFLQSQLVGQHRFSWPFESRLDWTLTGSRAIRDEPENRTLVYAFDRVNGLGYRLTNSENNNFWFRFHEDRILGGDVNLTLPIGSLFGDTDIVFKTGVSARIKERDFDAHLFNLVPGSSPPDGLDVLTLPPELVMAPENVGRNVRLDRLGTGAFPYTSDDQVTAAFAMLDLPLPLGIRLVGGARVEQWNLDVKPSNPNLGHIFPPTSRNVRDLLWSANLALPLSDRMNLRAAGYRTISRPDPREIARGTFGAVAGKCSTASNADLNRATIINGDVRWEWYPGPGEIISISGFYKYFVDPFIEVVAIQSLECVITPYNARNASNVGGEVELRKGLGFIGSALENFAVGGNFTYVDGSADLIAANGIAQLDLPLQDQSRYLVNGSLYYTNPDRGLSASLLVNYFDDRVTLYGVFIPGVGKTPDIIEKGRATLDFKLTKQFSRFTASLSGRNLTNQIVQETQLTTAGPAVLSGLSRPGVSLSLSLGYAF